MVDKFALDRFACEILFSLSSLPAKDRYTVFGGRLITNLVELEKEVDLTQDIFLPVVMEDPVVENSLKDGIYKVFIIGNVREEKSVDFENGILDTEWIFEEREVIYTPLSTKPTEQELKKLKLKI